jgi:hypothetical protein
MAPFEVASWLRLDSSIGFDLGCGVSEKTALPLWEEPACETVLVPAAEADDAVGFSHSGIQSGCGNACSYGEPMAGAGFEKLETTKRRQVYASKSRLHGSGMLALKQMQYCCKTALLLPLGGRSRSGNRGSAFRPESEPPWAKPMGEMWL